MEVATTIPWIFSAAAFHQPSPENLMESESVSVSQSRSEPLHLNTNGDMVHGCVREVAQLVDVSWP